MAGDHSLISPSGASRWIACPASLRMCKGYEYKSSAYADEGSLAHALAESMLTGKKPPENIPDDMDLPVQTYVDTVLAMGEGATYQDTEVRLDLSKVVGVVDTWGTADRIAVRGSVLQVHDLKYGKGVEVSAEGNYQLIIYGLGVLELMEAIGEEIEEVYLVIHQPRLFSVSEVIYTVEEMRTFQEEIRTAAAAAIAIYESVEDPDTDLFGPCEKACRWCPAKGECKALAEHSMKLIIGDFEEVPDSEGLKSDVQAAKNAVSMSTEGRIATILDSADLIADWLSAVRERALELLRQGVEIPRYKLVMGRAGNRAWDDAEAVEKLMKTLRLKADEMYSKKIISPTEAEKLLKKSPKWEKLEERVTRSAPQPTIAPVTDKRPPVSVKPVADDFSDINDEEML